MSNNIKDELYDIAFEQAVLSSMIFEGSDTTLNKELNLYTYLKKEDFYLPVHQDIFEALFALSDKNLPCSDGSFVELELKKMGKLNEAVMINIMSKSPISNTLPYASEIKKRKQLRDVIDMALNITKMANELKEPTEIFDYIESKSKDYYSSENVNNPISSAQELWDSFEGKESVIKINTCTPFMDQENDGGFDKGGMTIVSGAPEIGKTHLVYKILENTTNNALSGLISLEFTENDYMTRLRKMEKINKNVQLKNLSLNFTSFDISDLIATLYRMHNIGVKLVGIDSLLAIVNPDIKNKTERVEDIVTRLDRFAKKTGMHIILIAPGSKTDNASEKMGVLNSIVAEHLVKIFIRITDGKGEGEKILHWHKNKQTKIKSSKSVYYCNTGNIYLFEEKKKQYVAIT